MTADTATLPTTHPLDDRAAALAALTGRTGGGLSVEVLPGVTAVDLRVAPDGPARDAVRTVLGAALPPRNTWVGTEGGEIVRLGPDEWLVTGHPGRPGPDEERLRALVAGHGGAAVDVSDQRVVLRVRGRHARELLSFGCALDLHPHVFPAGRCAQTLLGQAGVLLLARDATPDRSGGAVFDLHVRGSFAGYLADWLLDAALEFG